MKTSHIGLGLVASLLIFLPSIVLAGSEPQFLNAVVYVAPSGNMTSLERQAASVQTNRTLLGAKQTASVSGGTSTVQVAAGEVHEFAVKLPSGSDPGKFQLYKLSSVDDRREVVLTEAVFIHTASGMGIAHFDTTSFGSSGSSFKFITAAALPPGEYGFSASDSQDMFLFENK